MLEIHQRFLQLPESSFFLFGPRGTGKSTWLREVLPDALDLDLLLAIADIPELQACSAFGATPEQALSAVERAKEAWLDPYSPSTPFAFARR